MGGGGVHTNRGTTCNDTTQPQSTTTTAAVTTATTTTTTTAAAAAAAIDLTQSGTGSVVCPSITASPCPSTSRFLVTLQEHASLALTPKVMMTTLRYDDPSLSCFKSFNRISILSHTYYLANTLLHLH